MNKTLYEVLGVDKNASEIEIKKNYRKKIMKVHPDMEGNRNLNQYEKEKNKEACIELNKAYEVLSDNSKRIKYDKELESPFANVGGGMPIPPELFELFSGGLFGGDVRKCFMSCWW